MVAEISATDAARNFADLLDAVEHRGEHFTIVRRGRTVAQLEPVPTSTGRRAKDLLRAHRVDRAWADDLVACRALTQPQHRP